MCFFYLFIFFLFPDVRIPYNPISPSCPVLFGFLKQFFNFFSQVLTLQPTDDEDNSSDLSMDETIQHDETQSTNPVTLQVSASVIHQASRSSTTSLLLDNSSTALSTPTIQTSTSSWLAAVRLVSHVFGVVTSGFPFGAQKRISVETFENDTSLESEQGSVVVEFEDPVASTLEADDDVIQLYTDLSNAIFVACKTKVSEDCPSAEPSPKTEAVDDVHQLYVDLSNLIFDACTMNTVSPQLSSQESNDQVELHRLLTARQKQVSIGLRDERRHTQRHENVSSEPSDECSTETIQNDDTQSTIPVTLQVSTSAIYQTSTSSTTSLLLDNSSTACLLYTSPSPRDS